MRLLFECFPGVCDSAQVFQVCVAHAFECLKSPTGSTSGFSIELNRRILVGHMFGDLFADDVVRNVNRTFDVTFIPFFL